MIFVSVWYFLTCSYTVMSLDITTLKLKNDIKYNTACITSNLELFKMQNDGMLTE